VIFVNIKLINPRLTNTLPKHLLFRHLATILKAIFLIFQHLLITIRLIITTMGDMSYILFLIKF